MNSRLASLLIASLSLAACVTSDEQGDTIDDSFHGGGKEDSFGIADGSPEAAAILQLVNTATQAQLDDDIGLAANAAKAIVTKRQRDSIDSLAELDAVPYIGKLAFRALLDYVRDNNLAGPVLQPTDDPFELGFCASTAPDAAGLTLGTMRSWLQGLEGAYIDTTMSGIRIRTRECITSTDCSPWTYVAPAHAFQVARVGSSSPTTQGTPAQLQFGANGLDAMFGVAIQDGKGHLEIANPAVNITRGGVTTSEQLVLWCSAANASSDSEDVPFSACRTMIGDDDLVLVGTPNLGQLIATNHCTQGLAGARDGSTETQIAFFARY